MTENQLFDLQVIDRADAIEHGDNGSIRLTFSNNLVLEYRRELREWEPEVSVWAAGEDGRLRAYWTGISVTDGVRRFWTASHDAAFRFEMDESTERRQALCSLVEDAIGQELAV